MLYAMGLFLLLLWVGLPACFCLASLVCAARRGELAGLAREHRPLAPHLVRAWLDSVRSTALISLAYPLGFLARRPLAKPGPDHDSGRGQDQGPPLLLIHGLYHNPSAWLLFRRRLARQGLPDSHVYGYNTFTRVYAEMVEEAARTALAVLAQRPGRKLVLIGHSLGGLVARGVAARPELAGRIQAVITLGAPHGGSALARVAPDRLARSLRPESALFERLRALPDPDAECVSLSVPLDNMVFPSSLLAAPSAHWREERLPLDISHVGLIFSRRVVRSVCAILSQT